MVNENINGKQKDKAKIFFLSLFFTNTIEKESRKKKREQNLPRITSKFPSYYSIRSILDI